MAYIVLQRVSMGLVSGELVHVLETREGFDHVQVVSPHCAAVRRTVRTWGPLYTPARVRRARREADALCLRLQRQLRLPGVP